MAAGNTTACSTPKTQDRGFKNEGARAWHDATRLIKAGKYMPPADIHHPHSKKLFAQLSSRRYKPYPDGRLGLEEKQAMRSRGLPSPDIADAYAMAFGTPTVEGYSWIQPDDSTRREIAHAHNWIYNSGEESESRDADAQHGWNQRQDDDGRGGALGSGFGGVNTPW